MSEQSFFLLISTSLDQFGVICLHFDIKEYFSVDQHKNKKKKTLMNSL